MIITFTYFHDDYKSFYYICFAAVSGGVVVVIVVGWVVGVVQRLLQPMLMLAISSINRELILCWPEIYARNLNLTISPESKSPFLGMSWKTRWKTSARTQYTLLTECLLHCCLTKSDRIALFCFVALRTTITHHSYHRNESIKTLLSHLESTFSIVLRCPGTANLLLAQRLTEKLAPGVKIEVAAAGKQKNASDCGIFTLLPGRQWYSST